MVNEYKVAKISLKLYQINVVEKMDLHRKIGEMVFRDVMHTYLSMNKLQAMVDKIQK
jgi:hypothetical protein